MKPARLKQSIFNLLVRVICRRVSNMVIFNIAYFCVGGSKGADYQFRQAINQELFRRGFLKTSDFTIDNVIVDEFTEDDMDSVDNWFASDRDERTAEDSYVLLFTGRDRWAERNTPKRKRRAAARNI